MERILPACALLSVAFISACSMSAVSQNKSSKSNSADSPQQSKAAGKQSGELQTEIERIAMTAGGRVGVKALLLETGESVALNPAEHFPMQSVYKLPIGMAVLRQVDAGKLKLEQMVRVEKSDFVKVGQHSPIRDRNADGVELSVSELLRFAVSESDGTASDVLLRLVGGAEAVGHYLNELKVSGIAVMDSEKEIGRDWETQYRNRASPEGAVELLRALFEQRGLSTESRALLLKFMTESPTGAKRLKGLLPKGALVAHKTGTSGANASGVNAATNDIGIITLPDGRHVAIAVFVSDSTASDAEREGAIAKIARAVWDKWGN